MRLKDYQNAALDTLSAYLRILRAGYDSRADELAALEKIPEPTRSRMMERLGDPVAEAWKEAQKTGHAASPSQWHPMKDGAGRSVPHVCLKLPTGGGKTLLAAHGTDRILVSHFRQTTGFVLWIVPSEAIYTQTKAQLADREHPIRQTLDRLSGVSKSSTVSQGKMLNKIFAFCC
jgi:type III restriction enzyme